MKRIKKIIAIILAGILFSGSFFAFGNEAPEIIPETGEAVKGGSWFNLDSNYIDHGSVNVNGHKVTTKKCTWIPENWVDGSKRAFSHNESGVVIDNYLFKLENKGLLKVKDKNSGVVKELDIIIPDVAIVGNDPVYTVLKGFDNYSNKPYYSLLVYQNVSAGVSWYRFQLDDAFKSAKEKIHATHINQWHPWASKSSNVYKIISLIRVPSLLPTKDSKYFGNSDFAVAVMYHKNTPERIYYHVLNWNCGSHDGQLNNRFIDYKPYIQYHLKNKTWDVWFKGYLKSLDAISGTTYIGKDGEYKVLLGINCWGKVGSQGIKGPEPFAAMKMVNFNVLCENKTTYKLQMVGSRDYTLVNMADTFSEGHYATVATWTSPAEGTKAKQYYGFVSPFDRSDHKFYKRGWTEAEYDWSDSTLSAFNVFPKFNVPDSATGDGMVVQGMVLCVPPHPELYKNILNSYVNVKSSIKCTEWNGTKSSVENTYTIEAGGCTPIVPFAGSASRQWSQEKSSKDWTTFSTGSNTKLNNFRENMIIGIRPYWEAKCSVLRGNSGLNVRYANLPANDKAYVTMAAVMGKDKSGVTAVTSDSTNPGKSITDKDIVLTKGMSAYSATKLNSGDDGKLYDKLIQTCENLDDLYQKGEIRQVVDTRDILTSVVPRDVWFNIEKGQEKSCSSTNSVSVKVKTGVDKIATLSNETKASITKTYGSSVTNEDGCGFGYAYSGSGDKKDISEHIEVKPVMYWIPVSELRAKYPNRTEKADLTFIPNYIWDNSMDYWLMAYRIIGPVHSK